MQRPSIDDCDSDLELLTSLCFGGSMEGNFYALDARTGKPLWNYQIGAEMYSNIMSFGVDGKQRIAVTSVHALFVFGLEQLLLVSQVN